MTSQPPSVSALARIRVLEGSLRCCTLGLFGLIPVLGLPAALLALLQFRSVCLTKGCHWNAAGTFLIWGAILGGIGISISLLVLGIVVLVVAGSLAG